MNAHYFGCLLDVQAAKEAQLDYARFPLIEFRQILKCFVERHQISGLLFDDLQRLFQHNLLSPAAALLVLLLTCVINQDAPHQFRANAKELRAILPIRPFLID
jgi:hypothetical protein